MKSPGSQPFMPYVPSTVRLLSLSCKPKTKIERAQMDSTKQDIETPKQNIDNWLSHNEIFFLWAFFPFSLEFDDKLQSFRQGWKRE